MPPLFLMDKYKCSEADAYGMFHMAKNWWLGFSISTAKYSRILRLFEECYPEPMVDWEKIIDLLETPFEETISAHKL